MNYPDRDYETAKLKYDTTAFTYNEITEKLKKYYYVPKEIYDVIPLSIWYRYYDTEKGFRTGGFLIKNDPEFLVFKNLSKNYTWSVAKKNLEALWLRPRMKKNKVTKYYKEFIDLYELNKASFYDDV